MSRDGIVLSMSGGDTLRGDPVLGRKIRAKRIEKKMTQVDLAAAIDRHRTTISGYETGSVHPGGVALVRMSKVLEMDPDFLAADEGEPVEGAGRLREPREAELVRLFRRLPDVEKNAYLAMLIARTGTERAPN
jgi:transcriptional regulator with XRE-family HTH domain